jgi:hypothetical protein
MSTILSCPSCANALRVPDTLRGQQVRCPTCSDIFTTPALEDRGPTIEDRDQKPPTPDAGEAAGWKELPLQLSLDEPSEPSRKTEPAGNPSGPVGAVELKLSLDDDEPIASAPAPIEPPSAPPPSGRPLPPRLAEDDDDLKPCPVCGKSIHHGARQCYRCGADLNDHRPRSGRRSRELIRRDAEPHRGNTVLTLGIISLVATAFCTFVGLGLGLTAWIMGQSDLRKIRAGLMDRDGENSTQSGLVCGIIGTCLNGLMLVCCLGYIGVMFSAFNAGPTTKPVARPQPTIKPVPPPPVQPPGPQWKDNPLPRKDG